MFATYVRSSEIGAEVIYFGPMGCRTGFYLLVRNADNGVVYRIVRDVLNKIVCHSGEMFGQSRVECGNYLELDLECAKRECAGMLSFLPEDVPSFDYPVGDK
jgi:S-ribosylhomocysteine lyase